MNIQRPNLHPNNFQRPMTLNNLPIPPPSIQNMPSYQNTPIPAPMIPQNHFPPNVGYRPPINYIPNISQFPPTPVPPQLVSNPQSIVPNANQISTSVFVGSIPEGITDKWIESLLQTCGELKSWKRLVGANGVPRGFGFCEFKDIESTLRIFRVLTKGEDAGLELPSPTKIGETKRLVIKVEENIKQSLDKYEASRALTDVDREKDNISKSLVRNLVIDLVKQIKSSLPSKNSIPAHNEPENSSSNQATEKNETGQINQVPDTTRPISPRLEQEIRDEEAKEFRYSERKASEKIDIFKQKERRWLDHEFDIHKRIDRASEREDDSIERFIRDRDIMNARLSNWDDIKKEKEQAEEYYRNRERWWSRRKYIRDRELEADEKDARLEEKELRVEADLSKLNNSNNNNASTAQPSDQTINSDSLKLGNNPKASKGNNNASPEMKEQFILEHHNSKPTHAELNINSKSDDKSQTLDDRKSLEELVKSIPVDPKELFDWKVKWEFATEEMLNEKIKPVVIKRLIEYLGHPDSSSSSDGSEYKEILDFIISHLMKKLPPNLLVSELEMVLDEDSPIFVARLWRVLVFETEASSLRS
ncbi:RNA-binding protein 25 [Smittium culicis]|uniref:RNA-binding protein 25 n=1 Tax=Smittium culicis TaxID=133412 RepID=A0A1R1YF05_9FUNG|nr:RNA-binding protein 25 [Smittium culicis]